MVSSKAVRPLVLAPADVLQKLEVFAELEAEPRGRGEVLVALQRVEEVAYGAEVVANQLVVPVALLAVDGDRGGGRRCPSSR
ncbi:MAG: hypothetical protein JJE35_12280 [Thermoleophilia bacterium]|nr:hypothetical protein [Thermoleophilia bacterium]